MIYFVAVVIIYNLTRTTLTIRQRQEPSRRHSYLSLVHSELSAHPQNYYFIFYFIPHLARRAPPNSAAVISPALLQRQMRSRDQKVQSAYIGAFVGGGNFPKATG